MYNHLAKNVNKKCTCILQFIYHIPATRIPNLVSYTNNQRVYLFN